MRRATITFVIIVMFVFVEMASAKRTPQAIFTSQTKNLKHAQYVCKYGDNYNQRWNCKAEVWLLREWKETYAKLHPSIRTYVKIHHPCLGGIIALEDATYDPTMSYGRTHGNTRIPYGIGQANPGTKMARFGKDWATNVWTQLKWLVSYVQRYGGECQALAFRRANGSY